MGAVYLAREGDRQVALKVLAGTYAEDPDFVDRFRREAALTAQLDHPNLVKLLDFGEDENSGCYLVMEYVEGETLRQRMEREPFKFSQALSLFRQVCLAVQHAHERQIVHRDLKPENLLLDRQGRIVVADFGVARSNTGTRLTRTGLMPGTPEYMSPEQFNKAPVGPASDIYSLGIVLYEMLTGTTPFHSDNLAEVIQRQCFQSPPPPSFHNADLSPALDRLVLKALEKKPEHRYPSAAAFEQAVARVLEAPEGPLRRGGAAAAESRGHEATVMVTHGAALGPAPRRWLWLIPLTLLVLAVGAAYASLSQRLLAPVWFEEAVGAEPAPSLGTLFGAVTWYGIEVVLCEPTRGREGTDSALAAADRLASELRQGRLTRPDQLKGRKRQKDYEIYISERVLFTVTEDCAQRLGLKAVDAGEWFLALLQDSLALRTGVKPREIADYERDHPLRPEREGFLSPILERVYQRARHQVREGPLDTVSLLDAMASLSVEDRQRLQQAARVVPRSIPKK